MQAAMAIIAHALRMLIFETATTLRVINPALMLVIGSSVLTVIFANDALQALSLSPSEMQVPPLSSIVLLFIFALVGMGGYALMAILWHRHVLLSGMDRQDVSRPDRHIFFSYVGRAILVALAQLAIALPVSIAMGTIATLGGGGGVIIALTGILGGFVFIWFALRLSLILPAAALASPMTFKDSWQATGLMPGTIWVVAALLAAINLGLYAFSSLILPDASAIGFVVRSILFVVEGLIFISVLTTLYGHLIEGRQLG